jgi:hypothetical protein
MDNGGMGPDDFARYVIEWHKDNGKAIPFGAEPYLRAMLDCPTWESMYYADSAEYLALYADSNLGTWRGEDARNWKASIRSVLRQRKVIR